MKRYKLFILAILSFLLAVPNISQSQNDTIKEVASTTKDSSVGKKDQANPPEKKTTDKKNDPPQKDAQTTGTISCACSESIKPIGWIVIFSPVILLLLAFYYFLNRMKKDKYSLASALSAGTETRKQIITKKDGEKEEMEYTENIGSASRTIAFFTGITAIIIASCLTAFQGYNIIASCSNTLDFTGLWKILGALGIGVIPYGINVWNRNSKEQ